MSYFSAIRYEDSGSLDAFSRLRVSAPDTLLAIQSQYNAEPIQLEAVNTGTGVAPSFDSNTRMTTLSATAGSGTSGLQSYHYIPYEPGISQFIAITGVLGAGVAGATVDVGYFDANNGVIFRQNGTTNLQLILRTSTSGSVSDLNIVNQSSWNLDPLNGNGPSGITLDVTKAFILVIDLQFLGMGRVRVGFDINGVIYYAHQFLNANNLAVPYMQTASLPIQMLITASATGSTKTSYFKCATVQAEGGSMANTGFWFSTPEMTGTAGNATRQVIGSIRPKTTFNGITNRTFFVLSEVNLFTSGNMDVYWELVLGGTYAGQAWSDVNTTYSAMEYSSTVGTYTNLTGGIVIDSGYNSRQGGTNNGTTIKVPELITKKFPITLSRAGAVRSLGTLSLLATGVSSTSACRCSFNFKEIR